MKVFLFSLVLSLCSLTNYAQDTLVDYLDVKHRVCTMDAAKYMRKQFLKDGFRAMQLFDYKTGLIRQYRLENNQPLNNYPVYFASYYDNGQIQSVDSFYVATRTNVMRGYYKNGKPYYFVLLTRSAVKNNIAREDSITICRGWDTTGAEIPNFIYRKDAEYSGGKEAWKNYIALEEQKGMLNKNRALAGGEYRVSVAFEISATGRIENVRVLKSSFAEIDEEAIRIIQNARDWIPAVMLNKNVRTKKVQSITFRLL